MKKTVLVALLLLTGIALAFPQPGYSWGHRGWGGHRGGWYGPGAVIGAGIGAAAAIVGAGAAVVGAVVGGQGYGYNSGPGVWVSTASFLWVSTACIWLLSSGLRLPRSGLVWVSLLRAGVLSRLRVPWLLWRKGLCLPWLWASVVIADGPHQEEYL